MDASQGSRLKSVVVLSCPIELVVATVLARTRGTVAGHTLRSGAQGPDQRRGGVLAAARYYYKTIISIGALVK